MSNIWNTHIAPVVNDAIERRIFPGAVVLVACNGAIQHLAAYGTTRYNETGSLPVAPDTIYDIASLTKVFTATAALMLIERGVLALDAPAAACLPGLRASGVTIRHLLTHTSGLSLRLSSLRHQPPAAIRKAIYALEPAYPPGTRVAYVNINSLLLGDIVANLAGQPLDQVIRENILSPLGMQETTFCPAPELHPRIAPTEWDLAWRGGVVCGSVHDESAHALGGVAGHAGLFSTAADLWRFAQMWLDNGQWKDREAGSGEAGDEPQPSPPVRILREETVAQATRTQTTDLALPTEGLPFHCGWGWMCEHPIIMPHAPADTYGHTGYTGPAMMNVPGRRLCLVLLSNRTYPHRAPPIHHAVTGRILDAALSVQSSFCGNSLS